MSKRYLSLEETAAALHVATDELIRMRERGLIRGFADRGTWKFREEDVQQVARSRQADSDPDVPMLRPEDSALAGGDEVGEQPTIISKGKAGPVSLDSDSDVKLVGDLGGQASDDSALPLVVPMDDLDSDSDVRLVKGLDSLDSDSDVALVSESSAEITIGPLDDSLGSDSDVRLVADVPQKKGSDSDVKLVQPLKNQRTSDSDVALLSDDDDAIALDFSHDAGGDASVLADEGGLELTGDSSAMLLKSESGVSLGGKDDSSLVLSSDDDEGITLDIAGDSGISLESAADSGISLESVADSGISLEDSSEFGGTVPMLKVSGRDEEQETAFEIPALKDDSEFELGTEGEGETAVFDLADAEEKLDDAVFDLDEGEADDAFADSADVEEDLDVADDVLGEDDELDELDVFDADEEAFDEGVSTGGQKFASPVGAVAVEQEWGGGTFAALLISTALLAVVGIVMFDLVHNIWSFQQPTSASSTLLDTLGPMFGKK